MGEIQPLVHCHREDGVATLALNRPDVLNSFNRQMATELRQALAECEASSEVRVVVITGAGRAFCAGQDLSEVVSKDGEPIDLGDVVRDCYNPIILAIRSLEKPVVAAVNGVAAGAGANLALACDFVVASEKASFIQSFSKVGLIPDSGGTFILPRLVGVARATQLMMLAEKVSATDAQAMGMIYKAVPADELERAVQRLASQLAVMPTRGLGLTKVLLNQSLGNTLSEQLAAEEGGQRTAGFTEDYSEGVQSFLNKRKPTFTGR